MVLKVMVTVKRVIDPYVKVRPKPDGSGIEANKMAINPFDDIALEAALCLKETGTASEVVVLSIGDEHVAETLRHALAMGADSAYHLHTTVDYDSHNIALIIAAMVRQQSPHLVLMGKQSIDSDNGQVPQMLAARLAWPCHLFASGIAYDNGHVTVQCEIDSGTQTTSSPLPAIIAADLRLNTPRRPSLPNIVKAKRKPITRVDVDSLGLSLSPRMLVHHWQASPPRKSGERLDSVDALVSRLRMRELVP